MTRTTPMWNLTPGRKYRFSYMLGEQRRVREMVATYLSVNSVGVDPTHPTDFEYVLSGRPEFGTTSLYENQIMNRPFEVIDTMKCYYDRKA